MSLGRPVTEPRNSITSFVFRFSPNWDRWTTTGEGMRCEIYRPASSLARKGEHRMPIAAHPDAWAKNRPLSSQHSSPWTLRVAVTGWKEGQHVADAGVQPRRTAMSRNSDAADC